MKKIIAISFSAGVVLGALSLAARGTDPAPAAAAAPPAKAAGRVLVLENERTLTGDIDLVGDQYRVRRLIGETMIPKAKVLTLCASLDEAYLLLKSRSNLNDADERLKLADWCRQHALRDRAAEEADAALKLRPGNERIARLAAHLREAKARSQAPAPSTAQPEPESPRVEVTADSLGMFASKVQPILMNACVSCHTGGRGGSFQLTRVSGPGLANRKSLEKNLAAVLAQINAREPGASKLLSKAISVHGAGMTQAPLKGRETTPFRSLEFWVVRTAEANPHLKEEAHASVTPPPPTTPHTGERFGQDREPKPTPTPAPVAAPPKPPAKPASVDPVDPDGFNREFHPKPDGPR